MSRRSSGRRLDNYTMIWPAEPRLVGLPVYIGSPAEVRFIGQRLRYFGVGQFLEKRFVGVL